MWIYSEHITPRFNYIAKHILGRLLGEQNLEITTDAEVFTNAAGPKINYSAKPLGGYWVQPYGLLAQSDIVEQEIHLDQWQGLPIFFERSQGNLPFDIFSASFYLLSRYEEYLPYVKDFHGRFPAKSSLAYAEGFLEKPLVDLWAAQWMSELEEMFPGWKGDMGEFSVVPTVDVDNLFAFSGKGGLRVIGGILKDIVTANFGNLKDRVFTHWGLRKDPYDTFEQQLAWNAAHNVESIYFMLYAPFGQFDRNVSTYSTLAKTKIKSLGDHTTVAIHPSYNSHTSTAKLQSEIESLGGLLHRPVHQSRQHFLKMSMPQTFRNLVEMGITDDYSMGYSEMSGFRASTAHAYPFFDVELNTTLPLTMHPFVFMDYTFIGASEDNAPKQALPRMKALVDEVKAVNGTLYFIWHNRFFSEREPEWKGWNAVYKALLSYAND